MSSLNQGLWKAPQNSLIPALTHLLSFKVNYTALAAGGTTTVALPATTGLGAATYTAAQAPSNYAISASPVAANNEPQQGFQTYVSHMMLRNLAGGPLTPTGGTLNANSVQLIDQSQSNAVVVTMAGPAAAASAAPYYITAVTTGLLAIQPYDQLAVTINGSTTVASANTGFIMDLFGWTNQGL